MTKLTAGRPSARKEAMQALVKEDTKSNVRINFELPRDEHTALKLLATRRETTIANLLRDAIKQLTASNT